MDLLVYSQFDRSQHLASGVAIQIFVIAKKGFESIGLIQRKEEGIDSDMHLRWKATGGTQASYPFTLFGPIKHNSNKHTEQTTKTIATFLMTVEKMKSSYNHGLHFTDR